MPAFEGKETNIEPQCITTTTRDTPVSLAIGFVVLHNELFFSRLAVNTRREPNGGIIDNKLGRHLYKHFARTICATYIPILARKRQMPKVDIADHAFIIAGLIVLLIFIIIIVKLSRIISELRQANCYRLLSVLGEYDIPYVGVIAYEIKTGQIRTLTDDYYKRFADDFEVLYSEYEEAEESSKTDEHSPDASA